MQLPNQKVLQRLLNVYLCLYRYMQQRKQQVRFLIETAIFAIIFIVLLLSFWWLKKWSYTDRDLEKTNALWSESTRTDTSDTTASEIIDQILDQELHNEHFAANEQPTELYNIICSTYQQICKKTRRDGWFDISEQLIYQAIIIALIQQQDRSWINSSLLSEKIRFVLVHQDNESRRASAGHDYIKFNPYKSTDNKELRNVLTHELGHVVDFIMVAWTTAQKDTTYTEFGKATRSIDDPSIDFYSISWDGEQLRKKEASFKDFVSGYAMKWVYEDLAESFQLRRNHNDYFKQLAKTNATLQKKYDYFENLYNGVFFSKWLLDTYPRPDIRRWDSTKLMG